MTHFLILAVLALTLVPAHAQDPSGRPDGNIIFGDLKIEGKDRGLEVPLSFQVILYSAQGNVLDRQPTPANGRYRFMNVPNGEYDIAVETGGVEVARINFLLNEGRFTDVRKDLILQWKPDMLSPPGKPATTASLDTYARGSQNASLMEQAFAASGKKDYPAAIELLKRVTQEDGKDYEAWTELGSAYFLQGDKGEAEKAFKRALEVRPSYPLALLNLGKLQFARKDFEGAIQTFARMLAEHSGNAEAHRFLGESFLRVKQGSKAVPELEQAARLDPAGQAEAHLSLASLYDAAGYKNLAAAEYEKFLAKKPDYRDRQKLEKYIQNNKK